MDWATAILVFAGFSVAVFLYLYIPTVVLRLQMKKIVADARAGKLPKTEPGNPAEGVISITEDGFTVHRGDLLLNTVLWTDVVEITAYKVDLFAYDRIYWGFFTCCKDTDFEVHERMVGFLKLTQAVEARYDVLVKDWWNTVVFPAFAPNLTVIWRKKEASDEPRP
jgi:hypothetical protein